MRRIPGTLPSPHSLREIPEPASAAIPTATDCDLHAAHDAPLHLISPIDVDRARSSLTELCSLMCGAGSGLSSQARALHAHALMASLCGGHGGFINSDAADRIAETCGALVSELVDARLWAPVDLGFWIRAGALADADGEPG